MSIIKNILGYCAALTAITLSGCTAPIEIYTEDAEPRIVIYGEFSTFWDTQYINISSSVGYFSGEQARLVNDATVWVRTSTGRLYNMSRIDVEIYQSVHEYFTELPPGYNLIYSGVIPIVAGETYTLNVSVDFDGDGLVETYTATSTALPMVELESISIEEYTTNIFGTEMTVYKMLYSMQEPGDAENYYVYKISGGSNSDTYNLLNYTVADDQLTNGRYVKDELFNLYMSSNHYIEWTGQGLPNILFSPGDRITLYQCNVEKEFYDFVSLAQKSTQSTNPMFGGPPANIPTNIPGGAGYFAVYCMDEKSADVP